MTVSASILLGVFLDHEPKDLYPYQLFKADHYWLAGGAGILSKSIARNGLDTVCK